MCFSKGEHTWIWVKTRRNQKKRSSETFVSCHKEQSLKEAVCFVIDGLCGFVTILETTDHLQWIKRRYNENYYT